LSSTVTIQESKFAAKLDVFDPEIPPSIGQLEDAWRALDHARQIFVDVVVLELEQCAGRIKFGIAANPWQLLDSVRLLYAIGSELKRLGRTQLAQIAVLTAAIGNPLEKQRVVGVKNKARDSSNLSSERVAIYNQLRSAALRLGVGLSHENKQSPEQTLNDLYYSKQLLEECLANVSRLVQSSVAKVRVVCVCGRRFVRG